MIRKRRIKPSEIPEKKIIKIYAKGKPIREIARILKLYPQVVKNCLVRNNIRIIKYKNP